jgi:hypothetical protein
VKDINDKAELDERLANTKVYTGESAVLYTYFNNEEFNIKKYGD